MKITGSFAQLEFDARTASKALRRELKGVLRDGTKAWVQAMVAIVPTWSGMSQAAIRKIAERVDEVVFDNPVTTIDQRGRIRKAPDRRAAGEALGSAIYEEGPDRYFFGWQSAVPHFLLNEVKDMTSAGFRLINPGPYHSQLQARNEFYSVVNPRLANLKFRLKKHVKIKSRVIGGQ